MELVIIIVVIVVVIIIYRMLAAPSNNKFQVNSSSTESANAHVKQVHYEDREVESQIMGVSNQVYKYFQNKEYDNNIGSLVICNSGDKSGKLDFYYRYQSKVIGLSLVAAMMIKQGKLKKINDSTNELSKYLLRFCYENIAKVYVNDNIAIEGMTIQKDSKQLYAYILEKYERYVPELVELIFDGSVNYDLTSFKEMFVKDVQESVTGTFYFIFYSNEWAYNKDLQSCGLEFASFLLSIENRLNGNDDIYA